MVDYSVEEMILLHPLFGPVGMTAVEVEHGEEQEGDRQDDLTKP